MGFARQFLTHPQKALEDAAYSKEAISHFTWERTAAGYLGIIDEILTKNQSLRSHV
jgi:hypothetical protein